MDEEVTRRDRDDAVVGVAQTYHANARFVVRRVEGLASEEEEE